MIRQTTRLTSNTELVTEVAKDWRHSRIHTHQYVIVETSAGRKHVGVSGFATATQMLKAIVKARAAI